MLHSVAPQKFVIDSLGDAAAATVAVAVAVAADDGDDDATVHIAKLHKFQHRTRARILLHSIA